MSTYPTNEEIGQMLLMGTGESLLTCTRFPTGLCHFVFDVVARSGKRFVVRVASAGNEARIDGSVYWTSLLRPIGIPLPTIHYRGVLSGRHFTILERLPGTDLGNVFTQLAPTELRAIARAIVDLQDRMRELPVGSGYGFGTSYQGPYSSPTWAAFIEMMLARSSDRCQRAGIVDVAWIDRVRAHTERFTRYFASIEPRPFLDDLTIKNVLVSENKLAGIIDVDEVCFGDHLLHAGLVRMAILDNGWDEDFVTELCRYSGYGRAEQGALTFYTALYCVDFLGELGHTFNRNRQRNGQELAVYRRTQILESLLAELGDLNQPG